MGAIFRTKGLEKLFMLAFILYISGALIGVVLIVSANGIRTSGPAADMMSSDDAEKYMASTWYILCNNLFLLLLLVSGTITFGIITIINLLYNGILLGMQTSVLVMAGCSIDKILISTIPHGIFEIPGILCGSAAGLMLPYNALLCLTNKKNRLVVADDIHDFLLLVAIAILLIIIASYMESIVTYHLIEYFVRGDIQ